MASSAGIWHGWLLFVVAVSVWPGHCGQQEFGTGGTGNSADRSYDDGPAQLDVLHQYVTRDCIWRRVHARGRATGERKP
jgi:hypothetical protein